MAERSRAGACGRWVLIALMAGVLVGAAPPPPDQNPRRADTAGTPRLASSTAATPESSGRLAAKTASSANATPDAKTENSDTAEKPAANATSAAAAPAPRADGLVAPTPHHLMSKDELALRRALFERVQTIATTNVSAADIERLKATSKAASARRADAAIAASADITDPVAAKLALWLRLRAGLGSREAYAAFLEENALWPSRKRLTKFMEDLAFTEGGTVAEITALFDAMPPQTGAGMAALASAKLISGDEAAARSLAQKVWRENRLARNFEVGFVERFGKLLTPEDHAARADRLLGTWFARRATRRRRANAIRRLIPLLSPPQQKYVTARLSLYLGQKGAEKLARALPKEWARKPELARQRAQAAVRAKQYERAGRFLAKAPAGSDAPAPDGDWELRERVARALIEAGKAELAYTITAPARPDDENAAKEAAFLAGWIALRKRNDAAAARPHFERMLAAAD
ncbi:MAG: hypothetical protein AAFR55_00810, partial [Pseudomonadota bacterium]